MRALPFTFHLYIGPVEGFSAGLKDESNLYEVCGHMVEYNRSTYIRLDISGRS